MIVSPYVVNRGITINLAACDSIEMTDKTAIKFVIRDSDSRIATLYKEFKSNKEAEKEFNRILTMWFSSGKLVKQYDGDKRYDVLTKENMYL